MTRDVKQMHSLALRACRGSLRDRQPIFTRQGDTLWSVPPNIMLFPVILRIDQNAIMRQQDEIVQTIASHVDNQGLARFGL